MALCLSVRQPWAWAICAGFKPVENRTWWTKVRGRILIHAGVRWDDGEAEGMHDIRHWSERFGVPMPETVHMGGIVGEAEIVDCVSAHASEFFWLSVFRGWNDLRNSSHADQPQRLKGLRRSNANPQCRKTFG